MLYSIAERILQTAYIGNIFGQNFWRNGFRKMKKDVSLKSDLKSGPGPTLIRKLMELALNLSAIWLSQAETAEVNIQLDSHVGGDIYRPMHPLRTYVAFHKLRGQNFQKEKGDSLS